ncbi:hypothetical protein HK104_001852 [Borealophlyctis nickersoniae]|nr:hypothetical protein HK104_001852 [Borealophlyctis nickersoniae]
MRTPEPHSHTAPPLTIEDLAAAFPAEEESDVLVGSGGDEEEARPLLDQRAGGHAGRSEVVGLSFMALSALLFSLMSVLVKVAGATFPSLQVVLIRSIIQFILGALGCRFVGVSPIGPPELKRGWLVARGAAGATGLALYFFTIIHMPLGDGMTIFFTGPAFTALLAWLTLGEALTVPDIVATMTCLVGVALVARPEFLFGSSTPDASTPDYGVPTYLAATAAFVGAMMSSVAYCLVRKIGKRAHFMVHVTYFGLMSTVFSFVGLVLFQWDEAVGVWKWDLEQWGVSLGIGATAYIAQCFLNAGLQLANAGPATLMRNLDIVFAFVFGLVFFNEVPRLTSVIGATLILVATACVALLKWYRRPSS